jgi:hypothetical protein
MDRDELPLPTPTELQRIASLEEASRLSGLSKDTLKRHHGDKIIQMSLRRLGMRVGHALQLAGAKKKAAR